VTAHYQNARCNRSHILDLKVMSARLGPGTPAMHDDLAPRLRCRKCGDKQIGLIYTPAVRPAGNPYLRAKDGRNGQEKLGMPRR